MGEDGRPDLYVEISGDPVQGGQWSTAWGPGPDELTREYGVYQVFDRPHRIVSTATLRTPDGRTMESDLEQTFEDVDGRTRLTITQRRIPTEQVRDFVATVAWPASWMSGTTGDDHVAVRRPGPVAGPAVGRPGRR
jgi:uncharacterized protein YndB with AHSA1/START domain